MHAVMTCCSHTDSTLSGKSPFSDLNRRTNALARSAASRFAAATLGAGHSLLSLIVQICRAAFATSSATLFNEPLEVLVAQVVALHGGERLDALAVHQRSRGARLSRTAQAPCAWLPVLDSRNLQYPRQAACAGFLCTWKNTALKLVLHIPSVAPIRLGDIE